MSDTVQGWGYSASMMNNFQLKLFDKYAELLKRRFGEDFQEVSHFIHTIQYWSIIADSPRSFQPMITCP